MNRIQLLCLFSICTPYGWAGDRASSWTFYMENDMLSDFICKKSELCSRNQDRAYTGGFGYGLTINNNYKPESGFAKSWKDFFDRYHDLMGKNGEGPINTELYGFTAFTPDELDDPDGSRPIAPIFGDRPFGAMYFLTNSKARAIEKTKAIRTDFTLSIIGANVGRDLQQTIHCELGKGRCPVRGWDNAINDGHDIAFTVGKSYIKTLGKKKLDESESEWIVNHGFKVGLYTEYYGSITYRIGDLKSKFYALNTDPFADSNKLINSEANEDKGWIFSASIHAIAFNGMLQGWHIFSDKGPVIYDWEDINPVQASGLVGYVFPWRKSSIFLKVQGRTSEIDSSLSTDHAWGGIYWTSAFD